MKFYLGTHMPCWLTKTAVPLFISAVRLRDRKTCPRALGPWALDSGGFSELSTHGKWTTSAAVYARQVRRWSEEIGQLDWAAIQDWMCEPEIIKLTGLSVEEHQQRTTRSFLDLCTLAPEVPWVPVIQGWSLGEYDEHVELYHRQGVDLSKLPTVGIGSICRRQNGMRAAMIVSSVSTCFNIRVHCFGLKRTGLEALNNLRSLDTEVVSADSMAWSFHARAEKNGKQNDLAFALEWRQETLDAIGRGRHARLLPE